MGLEACLNSHLVASSLLDQVPEIVKALETFLCLYLLVLSKVSLNNSDGVLNIDVGRRRLLISCVFLSKHIHNVHQLLRPQVFLSFVLILNEAVGPILRLFN